MITQLLLLPLLAGRSFASSRLGCAGERHSDGAPSHRLLQSPGRISQTRPDTRQSSTGVNGQMLAASAASATPLPRMRIRCSSTLDAVTKQEKTGFAQLAADKTHPLAAFNTNKDVASDIFV